ncbi:hypothetical protein HZS_3312 [Henneguya salminicola]|nr:hypothetical protein HZS_3312 [Henneguya salminicola]
MAFDEATDLYAPCVYSLLPGKSELLIFFIPLFYFHYTIGGKNNFQRFRNCKNSKISLENRTLNIYSSIRSRSGDRIHIKFKNLDENLNKFRSYFENIS